MSRGGRPLGAEPTPLFEMPTTERARAMTEHQFQAMLVKRLREEGYAWQHVYPAKLFDGTWRTTTTAVGWPDLVAFRGEWVLGIECKRAKARTDERRAEHQRRWLLRFAAIPTGRGWLLDPTDDLQAIAEWIHDPESAPRVHGLDDPVAVAS